MLDYLLSGFADAISPFSLAVIVIGVVWGMIIGALPGLGLVIALSLALPFTYSMGITQGLLLLIATAAGAQFGNGVTAITIGVPGSPSAVLTVVEGHKMFKRGEGGAALFLNLLAAVFGQISGAVGFILFIIPLTMIAPLFLAPETFALAVIGLLAVATLTGDDMLKGLGALFLGLSLGFVGPDPILGTVRFAFGVQELYSGLGLVPVTIGLLGLGEFLYQLFRGDEEPSDQALTDTVKDPEIPKIWVSPRSLPPLAVIGIFGAVVAFFIGIIPGLGATAATFIVYQQVRLVARRPEELGHGSAEGLVAQNAADNAVVGGELVPTLGLGIPGSAGMAVLMGALVVQGIQPGPNVLTTRPELTGLVAAGLIIAGIILLPLGWVFSYYALRLARLWKPAIFASGVLLILLGTFAVADRSFEIYSIVIFGLLGFALRLHHFPVAATAIGFILSNLLEGSFRRGILNEHGSLLGFVTRPLTGIFLLFGLLIVIQHFWWARRQRQKDAEKEADTTLEV